MHELHKTLNEHLNSFLEAFNADLYKEIDWSKPYEVADQGDLAQSLMDKKSRDTTYVYTIRAWNTEGKKILFGLKIIVGNTPDDIKIGFTDTTIVQDDDVYITDDMDDEDQDALAREYLINLTAKLKANKEKQGPEYGKRCTSCGRDDLNLNIMVNAELGEAQYLCAVCLSKNQNKAQTRKLKDIEDEIQKTEKMIADMEEVISKFDMPSMPEGLEKYTFTPLSLYKSFQAILASLKSERMEVLSSMETAEKLNIQLEKAIENQDFEKSAIIRDQINKLKEG